MAEAVWPDCGRSPVMQVSSNNIVRFPYATHAVAPHRTEQKAENEDKVVAFTPPLNLSVVEGRESGLFFAAHRIASRVADGLDGFQDL